MAQSQVLEPPKLLEKQFQIDVTFVYPRCSVTLPVGTRFEEVLRPEFWSHVAYRFKADRLTGGQDRTGAVIEIRTEDHAFYGEVYVRAVRDKDIIVGVLREPVYLGMREVQSGAFEVRWNVGRRAFDVVRNSDREVVFSAKTKDETADWINRMTGPTRAAA